MPVNAPDASQFTRLKKLSAAQAQTPQNSVKPLSHLYQPYIRTAGVTDFLASTAGNRVFSFFSRPSPTTKNLSQVVSYIPTKYIR